MVRVSSLQLPSEEYIRNIMLKKEVEIIGTSVNLFGNKTTFNCLVNGSISLLEARKMKVYLELPEKKAEITEGLFDEAVTKSGTIEYENGLSKIDLKSLKKHLGILND